MNKYHYLQFAIQIILRVRAVCFCAAPPMVLDCSRPLRLRNLDAPGADFGEPWIGARRCGAALTFCSCFDVVFHRLVEIYLLCCAQKTNRWLQKRGAIAKAMFVRLATGGRQKWQ